VNETTQGFPRQQHHDVAGRGVRVNAVEVLAPVGGETLPG
jgi:hypothetical protein